MKLLLIVASLLAVACAQLPGSPGEQLVAAAKTCIVKLQVPLETVQKIRNLQYEDTDIVRQYLICNGQLLGTSDANGYNVDKAARVLQFDLPLDEVRAILQQCEDEVSKCPNPLARIVPRQNCVLASKVGDGFKKAVRETIAAAAAAAASQ